MVRWGHIPTEELNISKGELANRLMVPRDFLEDDEEISAALKNVSNSISAVYSYDDSPLRTDPEKGEVITDFGTIVSENLAKNLEECGKIIVMAVTLGLETERYLKKLAVLSPASHFFADAAASAYAEAAADWVSEKLKNEYAPCTLKPRFSPGYGDCDIRIQKEVLKKTEGEKKLGISLTDSFLMIPQKSITAFHGVILK